MAIKQSDAVLLSLDPPEAKSNLPACSLLRRLCGSSLPEPRSSFSEAKSNLPAYNLLRRSHGSSLLEPRSSFLEARSNLPAYRLLRRSNGSSLPEPRSSLPEARSNLPAYCTASCGIRVDPAFLSLDPAIVGQLQPSGLQPLVEFAWIQLS